MYMMEEIEELVGKVKKFGLYGSNVIDRLGLHIVQREYNGIGPEFFEPEVREKVSKFLHIFAPAAVIHDLRNYESDGKRDAFNYANWEFWANCIKCADAEYPWWNWKRYRAYAVGKILYDFVSGDPGWRAWMDCYNKTHKNER